MGNFWSRFDHFVGTMRSTNPGFLIFFNVLSFENPFDFQYGTKTKGVYWTEGLLWANICDSGAFTGACVIIYIF